MPLLGAVFRKSPKSRFSWTLEILLGSGVPVLQALNIVRETAGNVVVSNVLKSIHDGVKEGEEMTTPLRASRVFRPMIIGLLDIGNQTGALPDTLLIAADACDQEMDNTVTR